MDLVITKFNFSYTRTLKLLDMSHYKCEKQMNIQTNKFTPGQTNIMDRFRYFGATTVQLMIYLLENIFR